MQLQASQIRYVCHVGIFLNKIKIPSIAVAKRRKMAVEDHVFQSIRTEEYAFIGVKDILFFLSAM
jgi:hypothetical protein